MAAPCIGLCILIGNASGCVAPDPRRQLPKTGVPKTVEPTVPALDVSPAAVTICEAPGLHAEDLTARVRDVLHAASGVPVVDEFSVKRELAACLESPCPDTAVSAYRRSGFIVTSSVVQLGASYFASVRVGRGVQVIARATATRDDAQQAVEAAAREAGDQLRRALLAEAEGAQVSAVEGAEPQGASPARER